MAPGALFLAWLKSYTQWGHEDPSSQSVHARVLSVFRVTAVAVSTGNILAHTHTPTEDQA